MAVFSRNRPETEGNFVTKMMKFHMVVRLFDGNLEQTDSLSNNFQTGKLKQLPFISGYNQIPPETGLFPQNFYEKTKGKVWW